MESVVHGMHTDRTVICDEPPMRGVLMGTFCYKTFRAERHRPASTAP